MNRVVLSILLLILLLATFVGCVSVKATYKPPVEDNAKSKFSRIVNKPFNQVWDALINYSAGTFFGIDNFEKASGLLTLSFGASNAKEYVTGGYWKTDMRYGVNELHFEGDYVEYLTMYQNGELSGKMNIVVRSIDENSTQVTVNARYVFSSHTTDANNRNYSNTWNFNTGVCDEVTVSNATQGTPPTRKICPTYKAENAILKALE